MTVTRSKPPLAGAEAELLLHMIDEAARPSGHADMLREQLDGQTGV